MTDQESIAERILVPLNVALAAAFTPDVAAYDKDGVPGTLGNEGTVPETLVVISLSRIRNDSYRFGGANSVPGFFLDTEYRAKSVYNCRALRRVVSAALEDQQHSGLGPFVFNDETQPIDDDADYGFSGVDTWSFC